MRALFPGFYRPQPDEFTQLWKDCVFTFDTNILLGLYRYTPETRDNFLNKLEVLADRIWISHQAALEYHENRINVIKTQSAAYKLVNKKIDELKKKLEEVIKSGITLGEFENHAYIDVKELENELKSLMQTFADGLGSIQKDLKQKQGKHPNWSYDEDPIRDTLGELFDNKIGRPYSEAELKAIYEEGISRYSSHQPPGFADIGEKPGDRIYGDLVLWHQLMDYAKESGKPIILVTDEKKEDWWLGKNGERIGPHPLLIQEMHTQAKVQFYMYSHKEFLKRAEEYLQLQTAPTVIEEIEAIEKHDEDYAISIQQRLMEAKDSVYRASAIHQLNPDFGSIARILGHTDPLSGLATNFNLSSGIAGLTSPYGLSSSVADAFLKAAGSVNPLFDIGSNFNFSSGIAGLTSPYGSSSSVADAFLKAAGSVNPLFDIGSNFNFPSGIAGLTNPYNSSHASVDNTFNHESLDTSKADDTHDENASIIDPADDDNTLSEDNSN